MIPEIRGLPLVGHAAALVRDPVRCFHDAVRERGSLVRLRVPGGAITLVAHPDDLRHVLHDRARRYVRGSSVDLIRPMLGNGLPLSDGEFWLRQRRTMQPLFARGRIAEMVGTMTRVARRYLDALRPGEEVSTHYLMMRITRDVIVETMFSDSIAGDAEALDEALATIEGYVARYAMLPVAIPLWLPLPDQRRFRRAIEVLDRLVYRLLEGRRAADPAAAPRDLLDALLRARDPETGAAMSPREIRDEVVNIFFAGHETTANLMTWATLELTRRPEVEARVAAEVEAAIGAGEIHEEALRRLEYTHATLREVLRLHPPAWIFARQAAEDDELRGHPIRRGTTLLIFPYGTHRLPEFWPEPERFDPERFLRDPALGIGGVKSYAYLPFGAGPHVCIGNHFALTEALIIAAVLARRGRLRALRPEEARPRPAATLHVAGGLPARLEAR